MAQEPKYGFSACRYGTRSMYYYADNATNCDEIPPPVHNLSCTLHCDAGYFLDVNLTNSVESACLKCPSGMYSLGGGTLYSATTNAWTDPLPVDLLSTCLTRDEMTQSWEENCQPWKASGNGGEVHSGDNRGVPDAVGATRLVSYLQISATFQRQGSVTFLYKVDAEDPFDGLVFVMDTITKMPVVSKSNGWKEYTENVSIGAHTFSWQYVKDYTGDEGEDRATMKAIELVGTAFADDHCHKCDQSTTTRGDTVCRICKQNEYAGSLDSSQIEVECLQCPENMVSPAGSIGIQSCVTNRECQTSDYNVNYTVCSNGTRASEYYWIEPKTCNSEKNESVRLPSNSDSAPCGPCAEGYYYADDGTCLVCPLNQYLPFENATCQNCPEGHFPSRMLHFGEDTLEGWTEWPSVVSQNVAEQNSWRLSADSIVMDKLHEKNIIWGDFILPIQVNYTSSGQFTLTYALQNVPSSTNAAAWLELHMDDTDLPLQHGYHEGVHEESFNVDTPGSHDISIHFRFNGTLHHAGTKAMVLALDFTNVTTGGSTSCSKCAKGSILNEESTGCIYCPAGSYSDSHVDEKCKDCPENTYSKDGASSCTACGNNLVSSTASNVCSSPTLLDATSLKNEIFTYNLLQLQDKIAPSRDLEDSQEAEIIWDMIFPTIGNASAKLHGIGADYIAGIFRLVKLEDIPLGHSTRTVENWHPSFLMKLRIENSKEAGNNFPFTTPGFGSVECTIPTMYSYKRLGTIIERVEGRDDGSGIHIYYSDGDLCSPVSGDHYSSEIQFRCDITAVNATNYVIHEQDCHVVIEWRTKYACPECLTGFFNKQKSECVNGTQSVSFTKGVPCIGDLEEEFASSFSNTCTSITMDPHTVHMIYVVVVIVFIVLITLVLFVFLMHRRYSKAYQEAKYLKGQLSGSVRKEGTETLFEFKDTQDETLDPATSNDTISNLEAANPTIVSGTATSL